LAASDSGPKQQVVRIAGLLIFSSALNIYGAVPLAWVGSTN
jgi:hypothetical protein